MTPPFSIFFYSRDFNNPVLSSAHALGYPVVPRAAIAPQALTWTAFGGPDRSTLRVDGSATTLLQLAGLLRCPVRISDQVASPVWWGYVDKITINFFGSLFSISLDQLFNKVKVTYSFISPDNRLADQLETDYAESAASQIEFGIKEIVLHRLNLDEDFAEEFRDTFLELHQWPTSVLSTREKPGDCFAIITCSGWIHTLGWQSYENLDGFYANYGPGPGSFQFGISGYRIPSQKFTPSVSCDLKYVYFLLRKNNSPTNVLTARLYSDSGGSPNAVLASSGTVDGASLPATGYSWIRFDFTPYTLSAVTPYWVGVIAAPHATNNFFIRVDENACYHQANHYAKYYSSGAWYVLPNVTSPATYPDLHFRVVCVSDTGTHLYDIASAGNQFFKNILTLSTGVDASPFKSGQNTCLQELITLMELGTSNNRLILADVSPDMVLRFYEQPDPTKPSVWLDRYGHFYSQENKLIPSHKPPVGQWAGLLDPGHFTMPFDQARAPGCFVQSAKLDCFTNVIKIN